MVRCMELVSLSKGQTLFRAGELPTHVHFLVGAVVSMMNDMTDGYSVETYMLGRTCMVGAAATDGPSFYRATVRGAGLAYRMALPDLERLRQECPVFRQEAMQALRQMAMQMAQTIACAKRHSVEQQLIRWVLTTLDRTLSASIAITHLELSEILGFRREAITLTFGKLAELGCVKISRGQIEVPDRQNLEHYACECYWSGQGKIRPLCQPQRILS